ncbi:Xaa-Pro peptidase family protein [Granulicella cerasi]|uniref:Xaa-Pro peptidase family protein n=1 Tax=Granulicella cerasi TaxID=741063 RepID=A0ABW1ZEA7_9BACT|nr:Xaa-Pro peptidase family protein [Granulicella cerasi]
MLSRRRFLVSAAATAPAFALHAQEKAAAPPAPAVCDAPKLPEAILALTDRRKDIVPITGFERDQRTDLARELMKQYKLDAVLITTGPSLRYYTGTNWGQSERLFAYVIPQAAAPFIICPFFERDRLAEVLLNFPERESTITYLWQENEDPFIILRRALAEANVTAGTLGIEEMVPFGMANMIAKAAPALTIASATPVTAGQRSLKSPAEIALLRLANQITFDVYKAVYLSCGPGDTNHKVEALIAEAYKRCGVRGEASCNVGVATATPHGSSKEQLIHEHEMVVLDDGCTVEGYTSDITRSFVYGTPTDDQRMVFEIVHNAQSAALAAARPGVEMRAIDAAARAVIDKSPYGSGYSHFQHRLGHGIGLAMHEWPYLVGGNAQKLMPGMFFSNEPGIYLPNQFGIRLEDDMLITENGAELMTWQSPSLLDPFAIPAKGTQPAPPPAETKPEDKPADKPADASAPASPETTKPADTPKP